MLLSSYKLYTFLWYEFSFVIKQLFAKVAYTAVQIKFSYMLCFCFVLFALLKYSNTKNEVNHCTWKKIKQNHERNKVLEILFHKKLNKIECRFPNYLSDEVNNTEITLPKQTWLVSFYFISFVFVLFCSISVLYFVFVLLLLKIVCVCVFFFTYCFCCCLCCFVVSCVCVCVWGLCMCMWQMYRWLYLNESLYSKQNK